MEKINRLKEQYVAVKRLQSWKYWSGFEDQLERNRINSIESELEELGASLTQEEYNTIYNVQRKRRQNFEPIEQEETILK